MGAITRAIEWMDGTVPVTRWVLIVFVVTMLFEIVVVIHAMIRR